MALESWKMIGVAFSRMSSRSSRRGTGAKLSAFSRDFDERFLVPWLSAAAGVESDD
jgi:hypothetical protein